MKLEIKELNMVGNWEYASSNELCTICKDLLVNHELGDHIVKGKCNHYFHNKCFRKINVIASGKTLCPEDGKEFVIDSNFYGYEYKFVDGNLQKLRVSI
jgi:hypothetical protein